MRDAAPIEAPKQPLFGFKWQLLPDMLELWVSNEACCLPFAGNNGLTPPECKAFSSADVIVNKL